MSGREDVEFLKFKFHFYFQSGKTCRRLSSSSLVCFSLKKKNTKISLKTPLKQNKLFYLKPLRIEELVVLRRAERARAERDETGLCDRRRVGRRGRGGDFCYHHWRKQWRRKELRLSSPTDLWRPCRCFVVKNHHLAVAIGQGWSAWRRAHHHHAFGDDRSGG